MDSKSKKCTKCGEVKPLEEFHRARAKKFGRKNSCKVCCNAAAAAWRKANPEKVRVTSAVWHGVNREKVKVTARIWRADNPEKVRAEKKAYRTANPEKVHASIKAWRATNPESARIWSRTWQKAHPEKYAAYSAARKARKRKATPTWADSAAIAEIYAQAQAQTEATGVEYQVDHQVPLKSKLVSGLHVEFNLRVIPKLENLKKGNRTWPDMP